MVEEFLIPDLDYCSKLTNNKELYFFFEGGFGKCIDIVVNYITNPFHNSLSIKIVEHCERIASSLGHKIPQHMLEPVVIRDHNKFKIPNTAEMNQLQKLISVIFDNIGTSSVHLDENHAVGLLHFSGTRSSTTYEPTTRWRF